MKARLAPQPVNGEAVPCERRRVRIGGCRDAFFAIVKDVDVARKTWAVPIEGARARDIAFWIAMRR